MKQDRAREKKNKRIKKLSSSFPLYVPPMALYRQANPKKSKNQFVIRDDWGMGHMGVVNWRLQFYKSVNKINL